MNETLATPQTTQPDLLKGITVEKDSHFESFSYRFVRGSSLKMTMQEVLLWEILKELRNIREAVKESAIEAL